MNVSELYNLTYWVQKAKLGAKQSLPDDVCYFLVGKNWPFPENITQIQWDR
jgi:hypothetical protein